MVTPAPLASLLLAGTLRAEILLPKWTLKAEQQ